MIRCAGFDAPVLRPPLLDNVQPTERLETADRRIQHWRRDLVHEVKHAIDAEADITGIPAWLQVDVAGALIEGVLQQPVDDAHDVLIVGVKFTGFSELHQLLEIAHAADWRRPAVFGGSGDRAADGVELGQVAFQIQRVGDDAVEVQPQHARELVLPLAYIGLGGGDGYPVTGDRHG